MISRELAAVLSIGKGSVDKIIHQLRYSKVCARWVPRSLTEEHKNKEKASARSCLLVTRLRVTIYTLKDAIRGKKFEDDDEVISEVKRWLRQRPAEWYREGIQALTSRWHKA
jgi:hypothetical protein